MVKRKSPHEEKCTSGLNFELSIPINISVSSTPSFQKEFSNIIKEYREVFGISITKSDIMKNSLFGLADVKNEYELISKNKGFSVEILPAIKRELSFSTGVLPDKLSKAIVEKIAERIKELRETIEEKKNEKI